MRGLYLWVCVYLCVLIASCLLTCAVSWSLLLNRSISDGFNLDLTYITDRIVAMGYPSDNIEGVYRNKRSIVKTFLDRRHPNHYYGTVPMW